MGTALAVILVVLCVVLLLLDKRREKRAEQLAKEQQERETSQKEAARLEQEKSELEKRQLEREQRKKQQAAIDRDILAVRPLVDASATGDVATVRNLLSQGADQSRVIPDGYHPWAGKTPLQVAAETGYVQVVELLLPAAADKDKEGALFCAADKGMIEVFKLLLEAGVDRNVRSRHRKWAGKAALEIAAETGHVQIVELLLPAAADKDKEGALFCAARQGMVEVLKLLLESGVDREARCVDNYTALHVAVINGHLSAVRFLVGSGLPIDAKGGYANRTALHYAISNQHVEMVQALLELGADIYATCDNLPFERKRRRKWKPFDDGQFDEDAILDFLDENEHRRNLGTAVELARAVGRKAGGRKQIVELLEAAEKRSHQLHGVTVEDWRSDSEKQIEREALAGNVSDDVEKVASGLFEAWQNTVFDFYKTADEATIACTACGTSAPEMHADSEGFRCLICNRVVRLSYFSASPGEPKHFKNEAVLGFGRTLAAKGGQQEMLRVAYRFVALGGRMSDLSRTWAGIGGWRH